MKWKLRGLGIAHAVNRSEKRLINYVHDVDRKNEGLLDAVKAGDQNVDVHLGAIRRQVDGRRQSRPVSRFSRGHLCLLPFMMLSMNAASQTTFSFAGLAWGESVDAVDRKLKTSGFTGCNLKDKLICLARESCDCNFEGPSISHGAAQITDKKLVKVTVQVENWRTTFEVLVQKYGQPKSGSTYVSPFEGGGDPRIVWTTSSGESIVFLKSHSQLIYTSGSENRKSQAHDRSNRSMF